MRSIVTTMKTLKPIASLLVLAAFTWACEKNIPDGPEVKNLRELEVPQDFNWSNAHQKGLTITLKNAEGLETEGRIIQLLDEESRIVQIARVSEKTARFAAEVPSSIAKLTVYFPMTGTRMEVDNIAGVSSLMLDLAGIGIPQEPGFKYDGITNCNEGCTRTISTNVTYLEVAKNETVCLTGNLNGGLIINDGGTLRICGTATITWTDIKAKNKASVIISAEGELISSSFYLSGANHQVYNFGQATINNWLDVKGLVENYGQMTVKGLGVVGGGQFDNTGTFTSSAEVNVVGTLNNKEGGTFTVEGSAYSLNVSASGILRNYCKLYIGNNLNTTDKSIVSNSGYLRINGWFYGNATNPVELGNLSMIHARNFQPNCALACATGGASIKVDEKTNIDAKTTFTGWIDICDQNGIENNWTSSGKLPANVTLCDIYIPVNGCNPVGIGKPAVQDADNDGIVDDEDEFPNDPLRAFSVMEPYAGYKLWAYEDLWPSIGDYDFNDIVIATRIEYILNANMLPVEAEGEVEIRAIGAGLSNGLAFQFLSENMPEAQLIKTVEGSHATLDESANNCIILAKDVMGELASKYNNNGVGPKKDPEVWTFKITFNTQAGNKNLLYSDFFIYRSNDRGHEVHISGRPATKAATSSLFGTGEDRSNPDEGYWYKTYNGIPWGLTLLTTAGEWNHPIEKTSILEAYPDFDTWATSGGSAKTDWIKTGVYDKCFHK